MKGILEGITLESLAVTVSKNRVPIEKWCEGLATPKRLKRLAKGTGVEKISVTDENLYMSDLCAHAAQKLLDEGRFKKEQIRAILFITQSPEYTAPGTGFLLQERLGLSTEVQVIDIEMGCSGFVHGLIIGGSMLKGMGDPDGKILLCGGDILTRHQYPETQGKALFGDAGFAAVIGCDATKKITYGVYSDGSRFKSLYAPWGGQHHLKITDADGNLTLDRGNYSYMDGMAVMDFTLKDVPAEIQDLFAFAHVKPEDIDAGFVHQANCMTVATLADTLGIPQERVPFLSNEIGNTSLASVPVCMAEQKKRGGWGSYPCTLLSGFGIGLTISSVLLDLTDTYVEETLEL